MLKSDTNPASAGSPATRTMPKAADRASPDFDEFCAAISKLDFLFTPDTSAVHIASAFNIPVFGLYVKYNTNDMIWSPYKSKFECIITTEPNLNTVSFEDTIAKFKPFFESVLPYEQRNSKL
jgi:ADP-heptose:LPS heptosyltransferase